MMKVACESRSRFYIRTTNAHDKNENPLRIKRLLTSPHYVQPLVRSATKTDDYELAQKAMISSYAMEDIRYPEENEIDWMIKYPMVIKKEFADMQVPSNELMVRSVLKSKDYQEKNEVLKKKVKKEEGIQLIKKYLIKEKKSPVKLTIVGKGHKIPSQNEFDILKRIEGIHLHNKS